VSKARVPRLVLASGSRWRAALLERFGLPFEMLSPEVDEAALPGEAPADMVARLARAKAEAVARQRPESIVIGSDQVAELDGRAMGKPGGRDAAIAQLEASSGRSVRFHTGVHVLAPGMPAGPTHVDCTEVRFRRLSRDEILRYLDREQPWDCAGSFRCEALGITLFERVDSTDPTALVGLPLIATAALLRAAGLELP